MVHSPTSMGPTRPPTCLPARLPACLPASPPACLPIPGGSAGLLESGFRTREPLPEGVKFGPYWRRQYVFVAATMPSILTADVGSVIQKLYPDAEWITGELLHRSKPQITHEWLQVCGGGGRHEWLQVCEGGGQHAWLKVCVRGASMSGHQPLMLPPPCQATENMAHPSRGAVASPGSRVQGDACGWGGGRWGGGAGNDGHCAGADGWQSAC